MSTCGLRNGRRPGNDVRRKMPKRQGEGRCRDLMSFAARLGGAAALLVLAACATAPAPQSSRS